MNVAWVLFLFSVSPMAGLLLLTLFSIKQKSFEFFPPPRKQCWQRFIFSFLFHMMFIGLVPLSFVDHGSLGELNHWLWKLSGWLLLLMGFGLAIYLSASLGWRNTFGEAKGLVTSGWYRWSRNPIYLVSIFGLIGWGVVAHSILVTIGLTLWGIWYIILPLAEEPWLQKKYGDEYLTYQSTTARLIGLPKKNV